MFYFAAAETHFKDTDVDEDDDPQYVDNEWPRLRVTRRSTIHLKETLMLPQSTHSLLFTGSVVSLPFAFAFSIVIVSYSCLALALVNNLLGGYPGNIMNVPVAVVPSVRGAQYLGALYCGNASL